MGHSTHHARRHSHHGAHNGAIRGKQTFTYHSVTENSKTKIVSTSSLKTSAALTGNLQQQLKKDGAIKVGAMFHVYDYAGKRIRESASLNIVSSV